MYSRDSPQHKDITRVIAYHIGKDGVQLSTAERAGFKQMIQRQFPTLSALARKYLCVCGTGVPSELIFSTCGYVVNNYRSRLHPKNVDYLIFLSHNLS